MHSGLVSVTGACGVIAPIEALFVGGIGAALTFFVPDILSAHRLHTHGLLVSLLIFVGFRGKTYVLKTS
jgi:ammonia channel protein AmtB